MPFFENSKDYQKHYGDIAEAKINYYYKYSFEVHLILKSGNILVISTGGDRDDIYRYEASSTDWCEHFAAKINLIDGKYKD